MVLAGVAAAALAALASAKPWAHLTGGRGPSVESPLLSSAGEVPLASALSLVALAAWGAVLVTRGRGRRLLALLGLVDTVALLVVTVRGGFTVTGDLERAVRANTAVTGALASGLTGWYAVALVMVLVSLACFAAAVRWSPAWPAMSARYDGPAGGAPAVAREARTNQELWKAIDEGDDLA
ncbi:MAG: Trp biosynthesis-associated membrane protein [Marmoricola sp.]